MTRSDDDKLDEATSLLIHVLNGVTPLPEIEALIASETTDAGRVLSLARALHALPEGPAVKDKTGVLLAAEAANGALLTELHTLKHRASQAADQRRALEEQLFAAQHRIRELQGEPERARLAELQKQISDKERYLTRATEALATARAEARQVFDILEEFSNKILKAVEGE